MSSPEKYTELNELTAPINVEPARANYAVANWQLYFAGRLRSQPNAEIGLTEQHMLSYFSDPEANFVGRLVSDWRVMIEDNSGQQQVFNAQLPERPDKPIGLARAHIDNGERWLSNVYVDRSAQRLGVARALVDAAIGWHEGQPFQLRVAEYNKDAQVAYGKLGFHPSGGKTGYYIGDIYVPQVQMTHPGA
jgi:GNAT superfamily N-acetyltransferase